MLQPVPWTKIKGPSSRQKLSGFFVGAGREKVEEHLKLPRANSRSSHTMRVILNTKNFFSLGRRAFRN